MVKKAKILVVEDNDFVRAQIVKFLIDGGYDVVEAADGQAAEKFVTDPIPDMVLADVMMEPVGGFGFVRYMRAEGYDDVPVVLVTGDQNNDLLTESQKLGIEGVLIKPVQKDRLLQVVERALR